MNSTKQSFLKDQTGHFGVVLLVEIRNSGEDAVRLGTEAYVGGLQRFGQLRRHSGKQCAVLTDDLRVCLQRAFSELLKLKLPLIRYTRLLPEANRHRTDGYGPSDFALAPEKLN